MQEIGKFIVHHLDVFVSGFFVLISCLFCLIQKRPVTNKEDNILKVLILKLPGFIIDAEKSGEQGEKKLQIVLDRAMTFIRHNILLNDDEEFAWRENITYLVESMLSTPRKKK